MSYARFVDCRFMTKMLPTCDERLSERCFPAAGRQRGRRVLSMTKSLDIHRLLQGMYYRIDWHGTDVTVCFGTEGMGCIFLAR